MPGRRYLPPPAPDDPLASGLRALAKRDLDGGRNPGDWSREERERWLGSRHAQREFMTFYEPARWPERLHAPPVWADEAGLIAMETLIVVASAHLPNTLWSALALMPAWHSTDKLETRARQRSATRHELTPETTPRQATIFGGVFYFTATLATWLWSRLRSRPIPAWPPWEIYLAGRVVRAISERRSWHRAYRR